MRPLALAHLALSTLLVAGTASATETAPEPGNGKPKQLVMISFDGAGPNQLWQRSRDLGRKVNAHFTFFLSCTLVIQKADSKTYQGPHQKAGRSNIGFAQSGDEARGRLAHIWQAHLEGHEIGSHTCGHFDGKDWSAADWAEEMGNFRHVLSNAWKTNGAAENEPEGWRDFVAHGITGFRAPYFSVSPGMVEAEKRSGFRYDASAVTKGPVMQEEKDGIIRFGLPLIPEGPSNRPIIAMDYNLYVRHSDAVENPDRSAEFEERAYKAFRTAFDRQYDGERIPLQIGLHFVEMNAGAYWRAMERLATEVCTREDVACVSYSEAIALLKERKGGQQASGL